MEVAMDLTDACLICSANDVPLQNLSGYNNGQLSYNNQLQVVLLLRKVLRLRKRFLESVLENTGQNPSAWNLKLCGLCHRIFEEASFVSNRLNKLNEEFEELSLSLRSKLVQGANLSEEDGTANLLTTGSKSNRSWRGRKRRGGERRSRKGPHDSNEQLTRNYEYSQTSLPHKIRREVCRPSEVMPRLQRAKDYHGAFDEDDGSAHVQTSFISNKHIKIEVNDPDTPEHDDDYADHSEYKPMLTQRSKGKKYGGSKIRMESPVPSDPGNAFDDADYAPPSPDDGAEDAEWMDDEASGGDSDYEPSSKKSKTNNNRKSNSSTYKRRVPVPGSTPVEKRMILKPIPTKDKESHECPRCRQIFDNFTLCNDHILETYYGGKWPEEFSCHICVNVRFKGQHWLKQHLREVHPGEKLPVDEVVERFIEEGEIEDLSYNLVPFIEEGQDPAINEELNITLSRINNASLFETVVDADAGELSANKFNVPFLQESGKLGYLVLPKEYSKLPPNVLKVLEREDKTCPQCQKDFPTELQLQGHISSVHEGEKSCYPCPICSRKFQTIGTVLGHVKQIHLQRKLSCERCGQTFREEMLLQAHIQRKHFGVINPYKCKVCGSRLQRRSALNYHLIKMHQLQIESYVPVANGGGWGKGNVKRPPKHMKKKFEQVKKIPCQTCKDEGLSDVSFATQEDLDVHVSRTHLGIARPFPCSICGIKYSSPAKLKHHMKSIHTVRSDVETAQTLPFLCLPCNKSFRTKMQLKHHLQGVFHLNIRSHICEICSQSFSSLTFLKYHQTQVHYKELDLTPSKCKYCGKILNNERSLTNHIKIRHTKDAKYKCPHCDMGFQFINAMNLHINIRHTKKDIFICPECPKTFPSSSYLKLHQLRIHSGLKPYECKFCQKKFADQSTYRRHEESHSNIIHDCPHCGKTGFKTRHSLRVHVRTAHGDILSSSKSQTSFILPHEDDVKVSQSSESAATSQEDNTGQGSDLASAAVVLPEHVQFGWGDNKPFPE